MPILPDKELELLKYHSEIFPEHIETQVRFGNSELIRWKFPNDWGASLVTTDYKYKQEDEDDWSWVRNNVYYDYHKAVEQDWKDKYMKQPPPTHTELVSLSFHTSQVGMVHYNYVVPSAIDDISVADLVVVLSKIIGISLSVKFSY